MTREEASKLFDVAIGDLVAIARTADEDKDRIAALKVVVYYAHKVSTDEQSEQEAAAKLRELQQKLSRLANERMKREQMSLFGGNGGAGSVN